MVQKMSHDDVLNDGPIAPNATVVVRHVLRFPVLMTATAAALPSDDVHVMKLPPAGQTVELKGCGSVPSALSFSASLLVNSASSAGLAGSSALYMIGDLATRAG